MRQGMPRTLLGTKQKRPPKKVGGAAVCAGGAGAKLGEGQGKAAIGAYDRFWMKDINQVFGDDLELAFRASFFVWVCGVPFMLPAWLCPICEEAIATKFISSGSVVYFMFTLYKTTGDTINFGIGGFFGNCDCSYQHLVDDGLHAWRLRWTGIT